MRKRKIAKHRAEYESLLRDIDEMEVPQPPADMDHKFQSMLEEAKTTRSLEDRAPILPPVRRPSPLLDLRSGLLPRLAAALSLLIVGWFLGYQVTPRPERAQSDSLAQEVREMKKTVMLAMLENSSAAERMKAVRFAQELSVPDEAVLSALTRTINEDPNVGVRLMAVEALALNAGHPKVREALVQASSRSPARPTGPSRCDAGLERETGRRAHPPDYRQPPGGLFGQVQARSHGQATALRRREIGHQTSHAPHRGRLPSPLWRPPRKINPSRSSSLDPAGQPEAHPRTAPGIDLVKGYEETSSSLSLPPPLDRNGSTGTPRIEAVPPRRSS
jgi:hypothetical protein